MTAPRQPRQWNAGDPEPGDLPNVRDKHDQVWSWEKPYTPGASPWRLEGNEAMTWIGRRQWQELTDFHAPLVEVLPETPEPVSMPVLPTYETYFHGEKLVQCGGCGKQVLQVLHSCKGVPAPQSSPTPLLPLSAPVETEGQAEGRTEARSPQSETELKLWNLLDKAEQEYLAGDEPCDRKSALVRAIVDGAPPAPRVFFPGDTVPKGVAVTMMAPLPESGDEHVYVMHEATWDYSVDPGYPVVELITPSPQAWQATVDRAHQARLAEATAQPLLSDPGTGEA